MRIVIVGTGTNVGKTHFGVALVKALARRGDSVCGLKPIESGVSAGGIGGDAEALGAASSFHVKHPPPYALPDAVSPHLAARRVGTAINLGVVRQWVARHTAKHVVIETAGALFSPLGSLLTNFDLACALAPDVWILVAPDRLGVLHEVTVCLIAARAVWPAPINFLVALQAPPEPDSSTGTNAQELHDLQIASAPLTFPRAAPDSELYQQSMQSLLERLP